jgi:hypothetical protein
MKLRASHELDRLRRLVEEIANDLHRLSERGLMLAVKRIEVRGRLPERIRAWARLHYLPKGSPFCCMEPGCHLFVDPSLPHPVGEELRRRLRLRQSVEFDFANIEPVLHTGVQFDPVFRNCTIVPDEINERDQLGRTALWRAVRRGYTDQVESLLAAGADPAIPGPNGRTLLDLARASELKGETGVLIEAALKRAASP